MSTYDAGYHYLAMANSHPVTYYPDSADIRIYMRPSDTRIANEVSQTRCKVNAMAACMMFLAMTDLYLCMKQLKVPKIDLSSGSVSMSPSGSVFFVTSIIVAGQAIYLCSQKQNPHPQIDKIFGIGLLVSTALSTVAITLSFCDL